MKAKLLLVALFVLLVLSALAQADEAAMPFSTSLVCEGVNYPFCNPGGSCLDPCGYCACRADGQGPGICSFEYCLGH
jgi:hypothetical protein